MDKKNQISNLTYFENVSTKYCDTRSRLKKSFHREIKGRKDFIFNLFESQPYYKELMPTIIKNNRGNQYYKKMVKKGWGKNGKSDFFKVLMKSIDKTAKETMEKYQEKIQKKKTYKIPKLDLLKKQKEKIEKNFLKNFKKEEKNIIPLKKNKSMLDIVNKKSLPLSESIIKPNVNINNSTINSIYNFNNTNNNLNNTISSETIYTNNKSETVKNLKIKPPLLNNSKRIIPKIFFSRNESMSEKELKNNFTKLNVKSIYLKNKKLDNLINLCNEELIFAKNMGGSVQEYGSNNKSADDLGKKIKNELKYGDQKVIEEKIIGNKKYQKLQNEKFKALKKMTKLKVSDDYAYVNRKEIQDLIRDNEHILGYQIYLRDMKKFNKKMEHQKEIEKNNMILVESMLEDAYRDKEFLKYKIDNYFIKNAKKNELNLFNFQNKEDLYESKNNDKKLSKGNLLPKLLEIKDYCYGRKDYNAVAELENNNKDNIV